MSRIGKKPIEIPTGVTARIENKVVMVKGPKGELSRRIRSAVLVEIKDNQILVNPARKDRYSRSLWGLTRTLIANMIRGVTEGFSKKLEFFGVGFRAVVEQKENKQVLVMGLGFSHPVEFPAPENINFSVKKNVITIEGINKEKVGEVAAEIRRIKPPEPYKGKGIRYEGENVRRKVGKAVTKTEAA